MCNVFGIADDILVIGYVKDGMDHDEAVYNVLRWCKDVNLKCHIRCMLIPFFRALTEMPAPKNKKELQVFLVIINYLSKFSPDMSEVCKPLRKLTSSKAMWMWDASY